MRRLCSLLIVLPKLDFFYALTSKQARQPLTRPQQYNYSLQLHQGHETHTYTPRDYGMAFKHRPPKSYNKPFLYQREEEEESPTRRLVLEVASKTASEAFHYYMVCMWKTGWPQNSNMNEETAAQHPHEQEEEAMSSSMTTVLSLRGHHRGCGCTTMLCVYPRSEAKQAGFCAPLTILMLPKYRLVAQH